MVQVRIAAEVKPTEDEAKVRTAILMLWPDARIDVGTKPPPVTEQPRDALHPRRWLLAATSDLQPLRKRVWELRIIDAVRGKMLHGLASDARSLAFRLSKQAALAGRVSFPPTPHALGDLEVTVAVDEGDPWPDAERLAWWFAPETKDGEIVGPVEP